jgi:hypothetical protein
MFGWVIMEWNSLRNANRIDLQYKFDLEQHDTAFERINSSNERKLSELKDQSPEQSNEIIKVLHEIKMINDEYNKTRQCIVEQRKFDLRNALRLNKIWKSIDKN